MTFTTRPIEPLADPLARAPDHVWMSPRISLWGWGEARRFHPGGGADRIERLRRELTGFLEEAGGDPIAVPGSGPVSFVSVTFSASSVGSVAIVPRVAVGCRDGQWWMTAADGAELPPPSPEPEEDGDRARYAGASMPDLLWLEAVAESIREIEKGSLEKVVLARDYAVWSRRPFHPPRLLDRLQRRFPGCHVFRVSDLMGASPELLVRRHGRDVESLVLAGSAPVFDDPEVDAKAAAELLASEKDRWEHELAVRSVRTGLAAATVEDLDVGDPQVLRLDNVRHLATRVVARAPAGVDVLAATAALHPTAAVGGTPTPAAAALIERLEGMDRGRYAGPVGWVDARGDGEMAIALRCAEISGARARLFAGAGIVEGSLPEAELEETRLKLGAMMGALGAT